MLMVETRPVLLQKNIMDGIIGQIVDFSHFFVNFKAYELPLNIKRFC